MKKQRRMPNKNIQRFFIDFHYKLFYFTFYAGYMPLLLFLPIYFKLLGFSAIHVGIINGIRPILQSVGTPMLIMIGERLNSKKLLFIISCVVMIIKVLIIFLVLRPSHQVCTTVYYNDSDPSISMYHTNIHHKLTKSVVDNRPRQADRDISRWGEQTKRPNIAKKSLNTAKASNMNGKSRASTENAENRNNIHNSQQLYANRSKRNDSRVSKATVLGTTTASPSNHLKSKRYVVNDEREVHRIFVGIVILVVLCDCFDSNVFTLVDHSCVVNTDVESYGAIRLWGNLGWGMMTPVIGVVIHQFQHWFCGAYVGPYHYVFFFFIAFSYISMMIGLYFDFKKVPEDLVARRVHDVEDNFQYGIFLFASAFSGFCNGFLFTFVNWLIFDLGGGSITMGIATACKSAVDLALFFVLGRIIETLGHLTTTSIGFVGYIVVFLVYFAVRNAWLVVLAETVHAVVYAVMTSTSVAFLIFAAPAGSSPKMQGILQGIYWGFGTGCGSIFGGYCVNSVGFRQTFLWFTVITCVVAFVFLVIQVLSYVLSRDTKSGDDLNSSAYSQTSSTFNGDDEEDYSSDEMSESEKRSLVNN